MQTLNRKRITSLEQKIARKRRKERNEHQEKEKYCKDAVVEGINKVSEIIGDDDFSKPLSAEEARKIRNIVYEYSMQT